MPNLEDLYREIILDHYRAPRNQGKLDPPAIHIDGFNPVCGDELHLYLQIDGDDLSDVKIETTGCSISQASASLMTNAIKGKPLEEVRRTIKAFRQLLGIDNDSDPVGDIRLGDLEAFGGVSKFPVRIKCATLAWNALQQGLDHPETSEPVSTE